MRKVVILFVLVGTSWLALGQEKFALIELFTSQGCSSCPAADRNLSELANAAGATNIYALSFHVDYWNYIGWKDPYSSKAFTERQRNYARVLPSQVYTPQMIVNGHVEFVGSNKSRLQDAIKEAINERPKYQLDISELTIHGDKATFTYRLDQPPANEWLNVALVEKSIENEVTRGKNIGKTLRHNNVVRSFESVPLKKSAKLQVMLNGGTWKNYAVILYVQDENLKVVGATAINISDYY